MQGMRVHGVIWSSATWSRGTARQQLFGPSSAPKQAAPLRAASMTAQQQSLRDKLLEELERVPEIKRNGKATPELQAILDELKAAAGQNGQIKLEADDINGVFKGLLNTSVLIEGDGSMSLGALTFQQFGPKDLRIILEAGTGNLCQGVQSGSDYAVRTPFRVADGEHDGMMGLWSVEGSYEGDAEKDDRQIVSFSNIRMEPLDKSPAAIEAWLKLVKPGNPEMDDDGVVSSTFSQPMRGHRDFIYLDNGCQVTIGNRGAYVVAVRE